jgi:VanZ family protein
MIARNWWPVAVWLGVIRLESTDFASSRNTFHLLYRVLDFLFGRIDIRLVLVLDHWLRKSGHFFGYAILSGLTFFALRNTYRGRMRSASGGQWGKSFGQLWKPRWATIALLLTVVTATWDEIHQASLPSRTGRWQDVVIDAGGALVLQLLIYAEARLRLARRRNTGSQPAAMVSPNQAFLGSE